MRTAYALIAIAWVLVIAGGMYAYTRKVESKNVPAVVSNVSMATKLSLTSREFGNGTRIPSRFTCDALAPVSPGLILSGVPENAKSLVLLVDDPDVPKVLKPDGVFDHWVLFNIDPSTAEIPEGAAIGTPGLNGAGRNVYAAPCPPGQYEPSEHRYFFRLYALDTELPLGAGVSKQDVLKAMGGHIIEQAELVGLYKRQ